MNRMWWVIGFGISAPVTLVSALVMLFVVASIQPQTHPNAGQVLAASTRILEPQTIETPIVYNSVYGGDARMAILKKYLIKYNSPLVAHADLMVKLADIYKIDFRLLVAIAQQESNLCKKAPENSYNCWGFGIHSGKVTSFKDYPEAMETIAKWLAKKYKIGQDTPEEIMVKYNPPSIESGTGAWAKGVNQFMEDME